MPLPASMMHQDVSDLDFDTYINVASNAIPQTTHSQPHSSLIYNGEAYTEAIQHQMPHRNQLNIPFNSPLPTPNHNENPHETYFMAGSPNSYNIVNWRLKQQQQQQQQQQQYHQQHQQQQKQLQVCTQPQTPVTTPGESHNSVTTLNQLSPRPDYFYEATHKSSSVNPAPSNQSPYFHSSLNEPQQALGPIQKNNNMSMQRSYSFDYAYPTHQQPSSFTPMNYNFSESSCAQQQSNTSELTGLQTPVSDIVFPGTPQNRPSIPESQASSSPKDVSSPTDEVPFKGVFETIDQWGKNDTDKDQHETRHWRQNKRSDSNSSNTSNMIAATVAAVNAQSSPHSPVEAGRQLKKVAHNAIERRYRNNINDRIRDLKNVVPALYRAKIREKKDAKDSQDSDDDMDDDESTDTTAGEVIEGVEVAKKLNKATILHKATQYIHHLKYTSDITERENQLLQQILAQMPGGSKVLARFHKQKEDFRKSEQERQIQERKEAMELEKAERQRILRERAAQRAALAELLPKPSRRPYRRRAKKVDKTKAPESTDSSSPDTTEVIEEKKTNACEDNNNTLTSTSG